MQPRHQATLTHLTMRFAASRRKPATDLHTLQHQMTTIMQPFHCDLQPQIQDTHRTTHTGTTTRCRTQFPKSPHSLCHRLPSSPLPLVTTSQSHHTPFVTASQSHLVPRSTLPFVTTTLRHQPFFLTTSQSHHFPRSPLPFVTTLCLSLLFFCDVLLCDVNSHTALHQCQFFCDVL